jgi:Tfp pilus assembly protein PilF
MAAKSLIILFALAGSVMAQDPMSARALVNQGVTAFKNANYPEAVQAFQKAVDTDPNFVTARLYLATAYMQQFIPGAESPENRSFAESALREFNKVLDLDPSNKIAVTSIASLYLNQKQWDQAQQWYEKLTAMDSGNADAYYSMGFIAWSKWYPAFSAARHQLGMRQEDPGPLPDGNVKTNLKIQYLPILDQGLRNLEKALAINPQYDDAMAYMNLLIRERADLSDTPAEYRAEVKVADDWVQKALAAKKQKAEAAVPRIRVTEDLQAQRLIGKMAPVVPAGAPSGQVVLNVTIGKDGHVLKLGAESGPPQLVQPAMDAVRQWVYQPTLLNGQPVEVETSVTVSFR